MNDRGVRRRHDYGAETPVQQPARTDSAHTAPSRGEGDRGWNFAAAVNAGEATEALLGDAARSSGTPLPGELQRAFGASLGADLSGVRVHTGPSSDAASQALAAKAFTTGQSIHFAAAHYAPDTPHGKHLLAHEVAHTVQQSGPVGIQAKGTSKIGDLNCPAEHEADRAADAMVAGERAVVSPMSRAIQRTPADQQRVFSLILQVPALDDPLATRASVNPEELRILLDMLPEPGAAVAGGAAADHGRSAGVSSVLLIGPIFGQPQFTADLTPTEIHRLRAAIQRRLSTTINVGADGMPQIPQQVGNTCGAASLVAELLITDAQGSDGRTATPSSQHSVFIAACNSVMAD